MAERMMSDRVPLAPSGMLFSLIWNLALEARLESFFYRLVLCPRYIHLALVYMLVMFLLWIIKTCTPPAYVSIIKKYVMFCYVMLYYTINLCNNPHGFTEGMGRPVFVTFFWKVQYKIISRKYKSCIYIQFIVSSLKFNQNTHSLSPSVATMAFSVPTFHTQQFSPMYHF